MSDMMIKVENIQRRFRNVQAVADLSFSVEPNRVVGFIGANGAGKTTTMRMLVTLDNPDHGRIEMAGMDTLANPREVRQLVGWMPDHFGTYPNMDVLEYLDFFARAYHLHGAKRKSRIDDVMDFTDLNRLAERPCEKLSKGEKQRLCLGRTLLSDPEILILDEPAAGLDPKARQEFKRLVRQLKQMGKTLFISSHILSELGEMCDSLLFIDAGRLVHHGDADSLTENSIEGMVVRILTHGAPEHLLQWIEQHPHLTLREKLPKGASVAYLVEDGQPIEHYLNELLRAMIKHGIEVYDFHREPKRLEDAFIDMLRDTNVN
ncbi:ABC transporter ATP-binding protein [Cerasicoccus arenae]|uniref:Multidrug ABC transporter ATP-binding protein n=1 Tax=Cerasicoccus arenae TaxID=424488 RepID=A0A8J3DF68_9BACT|nr:ABC transporter ATP-binding protein [Cerasicoccus arenae]MBK1859581.1 ABC transporter ATP-binding protein [Cerasicoccus arenae]GHB92854.1 multidrug ABC transporter ATP-binding protein [Cerasicoccus arenae]